MKYILSYEESKKAIIVPVMENLKVKENINYKKEIDEYIKRGLFKGKEEEICSIPIFCNEETKYVVLTGLGESIDADTLADSIGKAVQKVQELNIDSISLRIDNIEENIDENKFSRAIIGAGLGEYKFDIFKSKDKITDIKELEIITEFNNAENILKEAEIIIESTVETRNLANLPANKLKPENLADRVKELGLQCGFETEIYEEDKIKEFKMDAFLSVAKGSDARPRLIVMRYKGSDNKETFGLVGKGLTYDSGGYSIKSTSAMSTMKDDMSGAAAVIGAMCGVSKAKLPVNVTAVVAACENMVSGHSMVPGDIVRSMCGKYIEIEDTDCEGRLTLIDAVHYAVSVEKCSKVLDIATLTYGVVRAVGDLYAGILNNEQKLIEDIKNAASLSGEHVWEFPYTKKIKSMLKSKVADITNVGDEKGLACSVGGAFIAEGTDNKPWIHIDMAGMSTISEDRPCCRKGATGYGVNLIYQFVKNL